MASLTPRQWLVLVPMTLLWGINWPIMKLAVTGFPPLSFRALSIVLGLPGLALALKLLKVPLAVPRRHWPELAKLALTNMVIWHVLAILALPHLASGRAAILAYTMPVFSALWGLALWGDRLTARQTVGVLLAGLAVLLLMWHELGHLGGAPWAAGAMLVAAAAWALGSQQLRRTTSPVPTLAITFWMTAITALVLCSLAVALEQDRWQAPTTPVLLAVAYNAVAIFGFCQAGLFYLSRTLPPVASSISIMVIPVEGILAATLCFGEPLYWQDVAAMGLIAAAIAAVMLTLRKRPAAVPTLVKT